MKVTGQPRISPKRAATFASDFSGSRPTWPKMICFQPRSWPNLSVSFIDRSRISPSPTVLPGLASVSPRTSTGVPLGSLPRHSIRGMPARYCSSVRRGEFGSAPNSLRHQAAIDSVVIDMTNLRFFSCIRGWFWSVRIVGSIANCRADRIGEG